MPVPAPVFADDSALAEFNKNAAAQGEADRAATNVTSMKVRYDRYQQEYKEYCAVALGLDYATAEVTVDRLYQFLFYHAYRPKMTPKRGKKEVLMN